MSDRTVHARRGSVYVIRYDRAGKWYIESHGWRKRQVTLMEAVAEAARIAREGGGDVYWGLPGGRTFDAALRHVLQADTTEEPPPP